VYCPQEYFEYDHTHGCYTEMQFAINSLQAYPQGIPASAKPIFSPRDINGMWDKLLLKTSGKNNSGAQFVKWEMRFKDNLTPLVENQGFLDYPYDGWKQGFCLIDGKYELQLIPQPPPNPKDSRQTMITVPGYNDPVPAQVFINPQGEAKITKDSLSFRVDNTPPVVTNFLATEETLATNPLTYRTHISFTLVEPVVNNVFSGLPEREQLEKGALKVFVDDASFYTSPAVDSDGFWISSLPLPTNILTFTFLNNRSTRVDLTLPYRLPGHTMEVEVSDLLGNTSRYLVYPPGGIQ
jgi:hypothetical protein